MSVRGTFISFGSLTTRKVVGALLLPDSIEVKTYPIDDIHDESIVLGRFYTKEEMDEIGKRIEATRLANSKVMHTGFCVFCQDNYLKDIRLHPSIEPTAKYPSKLIYAHCDEEDCQNKALNIRENKVSWLSHAHPVVKEYLLSLREVIDRELT